MQISGEGVGLLDAVVVHGSAAARVVSRTLRSFDSCILERQIEFGRNKALYVIDEKKIEGVVLSIHRPLME